MADILSLSSRSDSSFVSDPDILEEKSQGSSPRSTASSLPRHFESIVDNQKAVDSQGPSVTSLTFFESASQSSPLEEPDRASEELLRLSVLASECGRYDGGYPRSIQPHWFPIAATTPSHIAVNLLQKPLSCCSTPSATAARISPPA